MSEAKEQVLANLANFAYDPKNMEHLKELQVTDLFLDMLTEENENFVEFGLGAHPFPLTVGIVSAFHQITIGNQSYCVVCSSQGGCVT